jgi:hypothetical protein
MGGRRSASKWQTVSFGELHIDDQNQILIEILRLLLISDLHSLKEIADYRGITSHELWRDICVGAGLGACDPWPGFPDLMGIPSDPRARQADPGSNLDNWANSRGRRR